jgi:hypothetical protein
MALPAVIPCLGIILGASSYEIVDSATYAFGSTNVTEIPIIDVKSGTVICVEIRVKKHDMLAAAAPRLQPPLIYATCDSPHMQKTLSPILVSKPQL